MIAGPESPIASPRITKMPVPMTAPMPSAVRSSSPTARRSWLEASFVAATKGSTGLWAARAPPLGCHPHAASLSRNRSGTAARADDEHGPLGPLHERERDVAEQPRGHP